jgi:hypothetical protein
LYLPRLRDDNVFHHTLGTGAESRDFFGVAQGKEGDRYLGFSFGRRTSLFLDSSLLLIEPITAAGYAEALRAEEDAARAAVVPPLPAGNSGADAIPPKAADAAKPSYAVNAVTPAAVASKKQFYGSIELDPILAKKQFADLVDEVVQHFTARQGVKVRIAIEIQADSNSGFDDGLQRAVKENCNVLRFKNAEFEE